jgi:hypothetical protein
LLDQSQAIVYVKDLDGRYLAVSDRYREFFGIDQDIRGRTDAELAAEVTIDGPRRSAGHALDDEPLQLEYTVEPFDGRPALAVWRFVVSSPDDGPVAVCAVAAPVGEAPVARAECARLMTVMEGREESNDASTGDGGQIEALHRASALAARRAHELLSELMSEREIRELAERRLAAAEKRASELEHSLQARESELPLVDDRDGLVSKLEQAEEALAVARTRAEQAEAEASAAHARTEELEAIAQQAGARLADAVARVAELENALSATRVREAALSAALENDESELRRQLADTEAALRQQRARAEEAERVLGESHEQLHSQRATSEERQQSLIAAHERINELEVAVAGERARVESLEASVAGERTRAAEAQRELEERRELHGKLEQQLTDAGLRAAGLEQALAATDARAAELASALPQAEVSASAAHARVRELESALDARVVALEQTEGALVTERLRVAELERQLAVGQAELVVLRAELQPEDAERGDGPASAAARVSWDWAAQRALTTAIADIEDWRAGLKAALTVLGREGGWDAACAWRLEEQHTAVRCFATWTARPDRMREFETATWQRRQALSTSVGHAFSFQTPRWLQTDPESNDLRIHALARHGIGGALIVPIRDGARVIAVLELLTVSQTPPSDELVAAIEAVALQLGHFWHLLAVGTQPVWRFGRRAERPSGASAGRRLSEPSRR